MAQVQSQPSCLALLRSAVYLRQGCFISDCHQGAFHTPPHLQPPFVLQPHPCRGTLSPDGKVKLMLMRDFFGSRRAEGSRNKGQKNPNFSGGKGRGDAWNAAGMTSVMRRVGKVSLEPFLKWLLSEEPDGQLISSGPERELGL